LGIGSWEFYPNPQMDRPDYPQDEQPGTPNNVPGLIHDYRAQREAWREQARNLARMREEVLAAADREARDIVTAARASVRQILLKARRDLLVLAAQVRAAGRLGEAEDAPETVNFLPTDDLGQARNALTTARNDVRRVLDESRPELEGLAAEGEALRSALRQHRPVAPPPVEVRRHRSAPPVVDVPDDRLAETPIDFEFTSIAADESPEPAYASGYGEAGLTLRHVGRPVRAVLVAAATIGGIALMGTGVWFFRSESPAEGSTAVESGTAAVSTSPAPSGKKTASTPAPAAARSVGNNALGERRSPIPDSRSPLSIQVAVRRTSWMRVTADGRVTAERIFKPGETQYVRAAKEVSIRAGNAGAVTVAVDGRQPVALGREGEVLTRRFAVEAPRVEQATPARATPPAPSPAVPIAASAQERPPVTQAAPPSTSVASSTSSPRVIEQLPVSSPAFSPAVPPAAASVPPRPSATSVDRPGPAQTSSSASQPSLQDSLTNTVSRFLDAHYRQDRATMAAISAQVNVADDRSEKERLPRGLAGVRRSMEDVTLQVVGPEAILTARMTERMDNAAAGQMAQAVSYVSHMWTQRNGTWQLHNIRIISASTLKNATLR
jgi:hypothetical protein